MNVLSSAVSKLNFKSKRPKDDDDEGEGDDEVAVDESQSHINEIW